MIQDRSVYHFQCEVDSKKKDFRKICRTLFQDSDIYIPLQYHGTISGINYSIYFYFLDNIIANCRIYNKAPYYIFRTIFNFNIMGKKLKAKEVLNC